MKNHSLGENIDHSINSLRNFFASLSEQSIAVVHTQKTLLAILVVASFLRLWNLETHGIFFGDAGRDFLAAQNMLDTGHIPLKGIATSVPIFHQGPLMVWIIGFLLFLGGGEPYIVFVTIAALCVLTVGVLHFYMEKFTKSSNIALLSSLILATSPLAIAHSRMAYHISLIPLFTIVFLITLTWLYQKKKFAVLFASIAWGILFQFELSLLPLVATIPIILYQSNQLKLKHLLYLIVGGVIGVLPFFAQASVVVQKILSKLQENGNVLQEFQQTIDLLPKTINNFSFYFMRFVSVDQLFVTVIFALLLILSIVGISRQRKNLPAFMKATILSTLLLTLGYTFRGQPSEAYMPPYFILLPVLIGYGLFQLGSRFQSLVIGTVILLSVVQTFSIIQNNFFVTPTLTNFHYSLGIGEQHQIMKHIFSLSQNHSYVLDSTAYENKFASYLDNFRYVGRVLGKNELKDSSDNSLRFFIEQKGSVLKNYPNADVYLFPSVDVIYIPEIQ